MIEIRACEFRSREPFWTLARMVDSVPEDRSPSALKAPGAVADSDSDSRLGTDGNQPGLELREGAADDAALLIRADSQDLRAQIPKREDP